MAKPSWVSVSPQSGSGNGTVAVGVTTNGGQAARSGNVTVVGTISGKTITKTIGVTQQWAGTLRLLYGAQNPLTASSGTLFKERASLSDNQSVAGSFVDAEWLQASYPWLGGSNVCNYRCTKIGGVFGFELNKIHIECQDSVDRILVDGDYWDLANAFCVCTNQGDHFKYTPVIRFNYNPSTNAVTIVDTLASLGGVSLTATLPGPTVEDPAVYPELNKMLFTGRVGYESNGYGELSLHWASQNAPTLTKNWALFHWYPKIIQTTTTGTGVRRLSVALYGRTIGTVQAGGRAYLSSHYLTQYSWPPTGDEYMQVVMYADNFVTNDGQTPDQNMDTFYRQNMFVEITQ